MTPMMKPILVDLSDDVIAKILPDNLAPMVMFMQAETAFPARSIKIFGMQAIVQLRDALTEAIDMYAENGIDDEYEVVDDEEE